MARRQIRRIIREELEAVAPVAQPVRSPFSGYRERNPGRYAQGGFLDVTDIYESTYRASRPGVPGFDRVLYSEQDNVLVAFPSEGNADHASPYAILGLKAARGYGRDYRFVDASIDGAGLYETDERTAEALVSDTRGTLIELGSPYAVRLGAVPRAGRLVLESSRLGEKAKSKSQQRLFGLVHAYKKGEVDLSDLDDGLADTVRRIASNISDEDAKEFASTKHNGLPERVPESSVRARVAALLRERMGGDYITAQSRYTRTPTQTKLRLK